MARRRSLWIAAALGFSVINAGGLIYALMEGELMHAVGHVVLLALTFVVWRAVSGEQPQQVVASLPELDTQLSNLQQSVDAIALEVERIGEGQRFVTKIVQKETEKEM